MAESDAVLFAKNSNTHSSPGELRQESIAQLKKQTASRAAALRSTVQRRRRMPLDDREATVFRDCFATSAAKSSSLKPSPAKNSASNRYFFPPTPRGFGATA